MVDSIVGRNDTEKQVEGDEVDLLSLTLDMMEAMDDGTYEVQLAAISRDTILYQSHSGYSECHAFMLGLQQLQQKVRADKVSSLKQTCIDTSI